MRKSTFKMMYQKYGRNFLFLLLHCGHRRCWSQQTWWGIHYLKLCITRNARAALTPFLSTYVVLYITTMVTGTINFSAYIPSTSYKISITTPKACQFNVWWKDIFFSCYELIEFCIMTVLLFLGQKKTETAAFVWNGHKWRF